MARKKSVPPMPPRNETILQKPMETVMHDSIMPYAEHVILERALPRVEDGLKPVQRRILFTMSELSMTPDKPHRKCARIVGDCLGKYHPHGDGSVYDAMVRMAQPFVMRALLVDGHGNFGSVDGDPAAAMRYTEARMAPLALEMLRDIDKDTVHFSLNFDDSLEEPDMLPSHFPNLLVNGSTGIAVGVATNIPPHNLTEAIDAVVHRMEHPNATLADICGIIPGPDFPTGGIIVGRSGIEEAYRTGRGRIHLRAKVEIEALPSGKHNIVITEIPYQVNKQTMLERIMKLTEEKRLTGIVDIRDESDRDGLRAVIELKKDIDPEKTLRMLYKVSDMQVTYGINMVAIADGKPKQLGLMEILDAYIGHQKDIYTRRTRHELAQAQAREHVLLGLMIAVDNLDEVIALIRASKSVKEAKAGLMQRFELTEIQAQAILDLRLQRLTGLEILGLRKEYEQIQALIERLRGILESEGKLIRLIKKEIVELRDKYGDARRTQIADMEDVPPADLSEKPPAEDAVVLMSESGIKRMTPKVYAKREEDAEAPTWVIETKTDQRLVLLTDLGNAFLVSVDAIPELKWKDRALTLGGLLMGLEDGESCVAAFAASEAEGDSAELLFVSRKGMVKRAQVSQLLTRNKRIVACGLRDGDRLLCADRIASAEDNVLLVTRRGMAICFALSEVALQNRTATGVRGITLEPADEVICAELVRGEGELLMLSERGYGKRCLVVDFEAQGRGGKGAKAITFTARGVNGSCLAAAFVVREPEALQAIQVDGTVTPLESEEFPVEGRASKASPLVVALMDNIVVDVKRGPGA